MVSARKKLLYNQNGTVEPIALNQDGTQLGSVAVDVPQTVKLAQQVLNNNEEDSTGSVIICVLAGVSVLAVKCVIVFILLKRRRR